MKKALFEGVATALVTPFQDGKLNIPMLHRLLEYQLEARIPAVILSGTTGESPALTDKEKQTLFREAKQKLNGHALMIAGTGSNCTEHAVFLSRTAEDAGADALLVVSPYYNKATAQGLLAHYEAIASAVTIPIILYNVPSRTGMDISVPVCQKLAEIPGIVGIKEASPDLKKVIRLKACCPDGFTVWSGNDDLALPMISLGAKGVISVVSNLLPEAMGDMVNSALQGDFSSAQEKLYRLVPLMEALFTEVNPIPIKAAMKLAGMDAGPCRLPLTAPGSQAIAQLSAAMASLQIQNIENSQTV